MARPTQSTSEKQTAADTWHVRYTKFGETEPSIFIRVKRLTIGDSMAKTRLEQEIYLELGVQRAEDSPADDDARGIEFMFAVANFPLLRFGTEAVEGISFPDSLETFWSYDEELVIQWAAAIREANPVYNVPFSDLITAIQSVSNLNTVVDSSSTSENEKSDSAPPANA